MNLQINGETGWTTTKQPEQPTSVLRPIEAPVIRFRDVQAWVDQHIAEGGNAEVRHNREFYLRALKAEDPDKVWNQDAVVRLVQCRIRSTSTVGSWKRAAAAISTFEIWLSKRVHLPRRATEGITQRIPRRELATPRTRTIVTHAKYMEIIGVLQAAPCRIKEELIGLVDAMWMTGMSFKDVAVLQWEHIDLKAMVVRSKRGKTGHVFIAPIHPGARFHNLLLTKMATRNDTLGVYPSVNGRHYIFNDAALDRTNPTGAKYAEAFSKHAGHCGVRPHDFRASFITAAVATSPPEAVIDVSGHANPSTLSSYIIPNPQMTHEIGNRAMSWLNVKESNDLKQA